MRNRIALLSVDSISLYITSYVTRGPALLFAHILICLDMRPTALHEPVDDFIEAMSILSGLAPWN